MRGRRLIPLRISLCIIFAVLGGLSVAYFMGVYPSRALSALSHVEATQIWQLIRNIINSGFFTAITGSLAGAFAGAYGGYLIVEKGRVREELLKDIRNTNATILIAFAICNSLLSLKGQHLKRLKETYDEQRREVVRRCEMLKSGAGRPDTMFEFKADFQTLFLSPLPIDVLQTQVFEKLSPTGQVILLTTTLRQTLHSLDSSIQLRNRIIEGFKGRSPLQQNELMALYFSLPYGGGHVNQEYPTALEAICEQTDDGIFFSKEICAQLAAHGTSIVERFTGRFGKGAPTVAKPDFAKAKANDLMPSDDKYADWTAMFNQRQPTQTAN